MRCNTYAGCGSPIPDEPLTHRQRIMLHRVVSSESLRGTARASTCS